MDKHVSHRKIRGKLFLAITAMVILAVAVFVMDRCGVFLPRWIVWEERTIDAGGGICITLQNREVRIYKENDLVHRIRGEVKTQDLLVTDLDRDGDPELVLLCWKRGKYGSAQPFWVKENPQDWSQHIFIYDLNADGSVTNKWFSSDNGVDFVRFKSMEKNPQILLMEDTEGRCTLWQWQSWGLKNMDNEVRFIAFGDNLIHDSIYEYAEREQGGSYDFLYKEVLEEVKNADLAALQLESILVDDPSLVSSYPYFGTPIAVGEAICNAGFDIVSCAGNHAADKGITGINTTISFFDERNVTVLGIQSGDDTEYVPCRYISRNGIRFALFDYTYGTSVNLYDKYPYAVHYLDPEQIRKDFYVCEADFKVVFVHWGTEYTDGPDEQQLEYADLFTELGADVIIGTHPHVIQPMVQNADSNGHSTLVAYSLGNFRAAQPFDERTKRGGELVFTVEHCWDGVRIKNWELKEFDIPFYR